MKFQISEINKQQVEQIENGLEKYDQLYTPNKIEGEIHLGAFESGRLIAGIDACMTTFRILYISTLFVEEAYRKQGIGKALLQETEQRAKMLGANIIRLDTFDWQGRDFYLALGYQQAGSYTSEADGFSEYFLFKKL